MSLIVFRNSTKDVDSTNLPGRISKIKTIDEFITEQKISECSSEISYNLASTALDDSESWLDSVYSQTPPQKKDFDKRKIKTLTKFGNVQKDGKCSFECGRKCIMKKTCPTSWIDALTYEHIIRKKYNPRRPCYHRRDKTFLCKKRNLSLFQLHDIILDSKQHANVVRELQKILFSVEKHKTSAEEAVSEAYLPLLARNLGFDMNLLYETYFGHTKGSPELAGLSPRDFMRHIVEVIIKEEGFTHTPILDTLLQRKPVKVPKGLDFRLFIEEKKIGRRENWQCKPIINYHKIRPMMPMSIYSKMEQKKLNA